MNALATKPTGEFLSLAPEPGNGGEPSWLSDARSHAMKEFRKAGVPTVRDEDWRFTNVAQLAEFEFEPVRLPALHVGREVALENLPFAGIPGQRLIFIDGHFAPELSLVSPASGVKVLNLAGALAAEAGVVREYLFGGTNPAQNPLVALNGAYFRDGALIQVEANRTVTDPIQLVFVTTAGDGETTHPRNLVIAGRGSRVTVLESFVSLNEAAHFTNSVTEIFAGESAVVEHLKFQAECESAFHIATIAAHCGRASNVTAHSFAFGGKLARTNIYAHLAGGGLECVLNGLYLTRGSQLADHFMIVDHAAPHCASHEYFNGILAGNSKGVFHGRIYVRPGAQKTDAKQTNKNLLLSDSATIDTKPQLEIYADDVKCTHGATIGQLSADSIFYLRARGIPPEQARRMLVHGFAGEIIERVRCVPAREELGRRIWRRIESEERTALAARKD